MRALVLHNPRAGDGHPSGSVLTAWLAEAGFEPRYCARGDPRFEAELGARPDLLVTAGGDGTILSLLPHLPLLTMPIAILPLGTANNIAMAFGIEGDIEQLVHGLRSGARDTLNVGRVRWPCGERLFLESVGLGVLATAIDGDPGGHRREERLCLARLAVRTLLKEAPAERLEIRADGVDLPGDYLLMEATNLPTVASALPLAPDADPGDGWLDLVTLAADRGDDMLDWLAGPAAGTAPVAVRKVRSVEARWRTLPFRVDDDLPERPPEGGRIVIGLAPASLDILVPNALP